MTTAITQVYLPHKVRIRALAGEVGSLLWHLVQMVLAMEAGMMVYHLLLGTLLAQSGYATLTKAYPLFGYWMMVVSMALPMIALMRYQKATWRYSLEMTTAMLAPVAALTGLVVCYLLPIHTLYGVGDPVMILAMAAFMLYRPHEHARGGHGHGSQEHANTSHGKTTRHMTHELLESPEENQE